MFTHFEILLKESLVLHQQVVLLSLRPAWAAQGRLKTLESIGIFLYLSVCESTL